MLRNVTTFLCCFHFYSVVHIIVIWLNKLLKSMTNNNNVWTLNYNGTVHALGAMRSKFLIHSQHCKFKIIQKQIFFDENNNLYCSTAVNYKYLSIFTCTNEKRFSHTYLLVPKIFDFFFGTLHKICVTRNDYLCIFQ